MYRRVLEGMSCVRRRATAVAELWLGYGCERHVTLWQPAEPRSAVPLKFHAEVKG